MRRERAPVGAAARLLAAARFEVVPIGGVEGEFHHLRPGTTVTVTCSPRKGIDATLDLAERLLARGFHAVPHLSARLVSGRSELAGIVRRMTNAGIREAFVIGGDAREPAGPYASAAALLRDMAEIGHNLEAIGIAGYPERHPLIEDEELVRALLDKQPFASYMVSQICFDPRTVVDWLDEVRDRGIELPLFVGLPGSVKRRKLLEVSLRIGVGGSVRYLTKHGGLATRLLRPRAYRPGAFLAGLVRYAAQDESIAGLHLNTFNQLEHSEKWRRQALDAYGYGSARRADRREQDVS